MTGHGGAGRAAAGMSAALQKMRHLKEMMAIQQSADSAAEGIEHDNKMKHAKAMFRKSSIPDDGGEVKQQNEQQQVCSPKL